MSRNKMGQNSVSAIARLTSESDSVASFIAGEMIQTSLQCSASDLQLCLALQSDSIFGGRNMAPSNGRNSAVSSELEIDEFFCLPSGRKNRELQRSLWISQNSSEKSSIPMFHSQGSKRVDSSSDGDISLDENALCFSPLKSINTLLTQADSMSQSGSPSSLLTDPSTKHNYYLAFEQSGIMDQSMGPLSHRKMNDSGTVCSSSRSSSDSTSKQLKCWTDVVDDEAGQESIVGSLTAPNIKPLRRSTSSGDDNGYSSSSSAKPNILNRMRPSPSLPLANTSDNTSASHVNKQKAIPRSGFSAPNLSFLSKNQIPLSVNQVEDWESLQILLPPQIRELIERHQGKSLSVSRTPSFASSKKISRRNSLETAIPEETSSNDVCPTCFKVSGDEHRCLQQSQCNCPQKCVERRESFEEEEEESDEMENSDAYLERSCTLDLMDFSSSPANRSRQNHLIIDLKQKRELVTCVKAAVMGLIGFREIRKSRSAALSRVIEQQFTSALQELLEDGLKPGMTLWSGLVIPCSPAAYQAHVIPMQLTDPRLLSDEERFQAFVKELLRLGDLLNWLKQTLRNSSSIRKSYVMDAFVFLIGSVTKDMWDDLTDTLALLNVSITPRSTRSSYSARIGGGVTEQNADRKRRLASKIGFREISVLPSYPKLFAKSRARTSPEKEVVPEARLMAQPRLRMNSRWSDWTLSSKATGDLLGNPSKEKKEMVDMKNRKSPSMFDIRSFL